MDRMEKISPLNNSKRYNKNEPKRKKTEDSSKERGRNFKKIYEVSEGKKVNEEINRTGTNHYKHTRFSEELNTSMQRQRLGLDKDNEIDN